MAKKRGPVTAAELMKQLESDPNWVRQRDEREATRQQAERMLAANEEPLVADLRSAGLNVESVYDLVNSANKYDAAIAILADHLKRKYHKRIREGIIRALSLPAAREEVGQSLIEMFSLEPDEHMRFVIANALSQMVAFADVSQAEGISEYKSLFSKAGT